MLIAQFYGCGGGAQSSDDGTNAVNLKPIVDAGPDQTITFSGLDPLTITLSGTASDDDGSIVTHQWEQIAGTVVTLGDASTSTALFIAPATTGSYSFSYTAIDNDGAQQTDSVTVYVTKIVFADSFSNDSNWSYVDNTGNGASWAVVNGQLRQSVYLETDPDFGNDAFFGNTSYHSGSYAQLVDGIINGVSDYRFSVEITPLINFETRQGNDVGIMFRYQDENNYYRVSMNARYGYTRFEKRQFGNFQTLAVNSIGYVDEQSMNLMVEVNGDTLIVWIDGDAVFAVVDDDPILAGTVALYCQDRAQFDNVIITEPTLQPMVAIASPLAYSVLPGDLVDLTVTAVVLNKPAGGSVAFSLDGGSEINVAGSGDLYSFEFISVFNGNHDVAAILRHADGTEASSDTNSMVGTGGDYYVTVGDSIVNGMQDTDSTNNDSADGRTVAIQGFQAPLADALTEATDRPQIVFNEGIGGDTSSALLLRVDSILERHPWANKVLLLIGTNDSNGGVQPTDFKNTVDTIASRVDDFYGLDVWIAKLPPTYIKGTWNLDTARNNIIIQYNNRINEICNFDSADNTFPGPDFFTLFNSTDLYADNLHPNDTGYQLMADEWHQTLTP